MLARVSQDAFLANANRRAILDFIQAFPGPFQTDVKTTLGLPNGTAAYHLYALESRGLIARIQSSREVRYYPTASVSFPDARKDAILRHPLRRAVYEHLRRDPALSGTELATMLGTTHQLVGFHRRRLVQAGLLGASNGVFRGGR